MCDRCYYKHPDPVSDPFYQSTVKNLMYFCAAVLLFVCNYLFGGFEKLTPFSLTWLAFGSRCEPMLRKFGKILSNFFIQSSYRFTTAYRFITGFFLIDCLLIIIEAHT